MRFALRLILLGFLAFSFVAPSVASASIPTSVSSSDPCPSKPQLNQCILEDAVGMAVPRGKALHLPCLEKAVEEQPLEVSPPQHSRTLAFEIQTMHRIGWIPFTMDPPPRLLAV